jgi:hypothetical protein
VEKVGQVEVLEGEGVRGSEEGKGKLKALNDCGSAFAGRVPRCNGVRSSCSELLETGGRARR